MTKSATKPKRATEEEVVLPLDQVLTSNPTVVDAPVEGPAMEQPKDLSPAANEASALSGLPQVEVSAVPASSALPPVPGSCINCSATSNNAVRAIAPGRYRCQACQHEWTVAEEQAPFRQRQF